MSTEQSDSRFQTLELPSADSELWLQGQKRAFEAALNGATLAECLQILIDTAILQFGGTARCAFYLANSELTELRHVVGMSEEYARCVDGFEMGPDSLACGLAVYTGTPRITPDVPEDPRWAPWLWIAEKFEYRGCWSFPVETSSGLTVGSFAMYFREPRSITERERELANVLTSAAAMMIARYQEAQERAKAEEKLQAREERQTFLLRLSDMLRAESDPDVMAPLATQFVAEHMQVDRCYIAHFSQQENLARVEHEFHRPDLHPINGVYRLSDFPDSMKKIAAGPLFLKDIQNDPTLSDLDKSSLAAMQTGAMICAILRKGPVDFARSLVIATRKSRDWSVEDLYFLEELAERIWAAIERNRTEAALRASERQSREAMQIAERRAAELNAVIDSINDAVYIGTMDGITLVNRTALTDLGFTEKEELNRPIEVIAREIDTRDPETGEEISGDDQPFSRAFRGERAVRLIRARNRKSGEERLIRSAAAPVIMDGNIIAAVAVNTDITDQWKTEAALRQTEKLAAVGRLASSIAHEINNPLEAVTNLLYLANKEALSPLVASYLELAQSELTRVSQIATETLQFHRQQKTPSHHDIVVILESVLLLYGSRLRTSQVEIERRFSPHPLVLCFANEIRQVIANLVGNALDAINSNGHNRRLLLRVRRAVNPETGVVGVRLTICDNGPGISESSRSEIFEPFFTTKADTGTGLGLWVSAEIVKKHQGLLHFRTSRSLRYHGTAFSLFLSDMPFN